MAFAQLVPENPRQFLPYKSILIVSDDADKAMEITPALQSQGYKTFSALFTGKKLQGIPKQAPDAIIIYVSGSPVSSKLVTNTLQRRYSEKSIPMIGICTRDLDTSNFSFDSLLLEPVHPAQIAQRVAAMLRMNIMQTEIVLRLETLREDFNIDHRLNQDVFSDRLRVLFIGKASPQFMVIINALEEKDVEVVAAFTSFTAFDFLHESRFDAVVMNALSHSEPSLSITQTMRRNSALFHTPSILLTPPVYEDAEEAYGCGVSDIINSECTEQEIQDRILELARFHRLHRQVKLEFEKIGGGECLDESGTYSTRFFSKHLNRLVDNYSALDLPVSILTIRANFDGDYPESAEISNQVYNQLGRTVKNMVRVYDVTARLSENIFVIAFPGQPASSLAPVIQRLEGITSVMHFGPETVKGSGYKLDLTIDQAELGHGVTGQSWARATAERCRVLSRLAHKTSKSFQDRTNSHGGIFQLPANEYGLIWTKTPSFILCNSI